MNNTAFSDEEFRKIITYLNSGTIFDRAKKLRSEYDGIKRKDGTKYIKFLNQKDWCKNIFQVSNQITIKNKFENRYDVTILINGLPLVQIELKRRGSNLKVAFNQVKKYMKYSYKGLFNYIQLFVISDGINTKYFANGNYSDVKFEFTFFWKDKDNKNIHSLSEFTDTFLEKCNLAKVITKYMVLRESGNNKSLMVLRAYQKYAVEALLEQTLEVKQNGYIWHTTGSGKTLTSFKASQLLSEEESIYKVVFVVDRRDLDKQTNEEFSKFCPGCFDDSKHTGSLVKNLLSTKNKLVTTTIQKLALVVKREHSRKKLESIKEEHIIFIYDECHRSQFGEMHNSIINFFTNSLCYGFTGTPILRENAKGGLTTSKIFGKQLHSYVIKDAIADNNVLGFSIDYYGGAELKQFRDEEVSSIDIEGYYRGNKERLSQIVDDIIKNYNKKTCNREFNAIFTVPPKGFVHEYYKLFKEKEHDLKVATIFSYQANEDMDDENKEHSMVLLNSYIKDYNNLFGTNFGIESFKEYHADVSTRMKNREIDLLIVVNMFLTGFDSPLLNTLYVDRNLEYHTLLQAFSRTNRIYNKRKSQGNIISYRCIKNEVDAAIRLFGDKDAPDYVLMASYEYYRNQFNKAVKELYGLVKTIEEALQLQSEKQKEKFVLNFRELSRIRNKLSIFSQFNWDDLEMDEQTFNDFKSVYLDIYHDTIDKGHKDKPSILENIDFELDLLRNDLINVDYIINLLKDLDYGSDSFEHDKNRIMQIMKETENLRSKIGLIEKFINERLGNIKDKNVSVSEEFDDFMRKERRVAICDLIDEEELDEKVAREIFEEYEFSGKLDDDMIENSFLSKLKLIERMDKVEVVKNKIVNLIDTFEY